MAKKSNYKIGKVDFVDGGDRKAKILPRKEKDQILKEDAKAHVKTSYDTETVFKKKYEAAEKKGFTGNDSVKRSFAMGVSFDKNGKIIRD